MTSLCFAEMAKTCGVTLVGGTVPERRGEKLYNTCCVFGTKGELLAKYSKVKRAMPSETSTRSCC